MFNVNFVQGLTTDYICTIGNPLWDIDRNSLKISSQIVKLLLPAFANCAAIKAQNFDIEGVTGSIPVTPTIQIKDLADFLLRIRSIFQNGPVFDPWRECGLCYSLKRCCDL
jgi:hypothetical protein